VNSTMARNVLSHSLLKAYKYPAITLLHKKRPSNHIFTFNHHTTATLTSNIPCRRKRPLYASDFNNSASVKLSTASNGVVKKVEKDQANLETNDAIELKQESDGNSVERENNNKENNVPPALDEHTSPQNNKREEKMTLMEAIKLTFIEYRETFEDNEDEKKDDDDDDEDGFIQTKTDELLDKQQKISSKVKRNTKRNVVLMRREGKIALEKIQEETGIYTKEDLKKFAAEMLKLATQCTTEFMKGYRSGRDAEIDRVLNEYFKEMEGKDKDKKKRRRKIRKRDLTFLI